MDEVFDVGVFDDDETGIEQVALKIEDALFDWKILIEGNVEHPENMEYSEGECKEFTRIVKAYYNYVEVGHFSVQISHKTENNATDISVVIDATGPGISHE